MEQPRIATEVAVKRKLPKTRVCVGLRKFKSRDLDLPIAYIARTTESDNENKIKEGLQKVQVGGHVKTPSRSTRFSLLWLG